MIKIENYEDFCADFKGDDMKRCSAEILFMIRNGFAALREIDDKDCGYLTFDALLENWAEVAAAPRDYLNPAVRKMSKVFDHIIEHMRRRILQENVLMPLHKANKFNGKSVAWLSKRAGRTVREKLSGTKSVMAVRRRLSLDTGENRLLKEMARRLEDAIFLKNSCLPDKLQNEDEKIFLDKLRLFRHDSEISEILTWDNPPPNNTLLEDSSYNAVWHAWNDFQKVNEIIREDCQNISRRLCSLAKIFLVLFAGKRFDFLQMPIVYNRDHNNNQEYSLEFGGTEIFAVNPVTKKVLQITPLDKEIFIKYDEKILRLEFSDLQLKISNESQFVTQYLTAENFSWLLQKTLHNLIGAEFLQLKSTTEIQRLEGHTAAVELFALRPEICLNGQRIISQGLLMFQELNEPQKTFISDCFLSRALPISDEITYYTFYGVIYQGLKKNAEPLRLLTASLNNFLHTDNVSLVYPDIFNEFRLADLKRNAKLHYNRVSAVPKSLTAIFTYVQSEHFATEFNASDSILILDKTSEGFSITPIKSRYDELAAKDIPEQKGIVWEHRPAHAVDINSLDELNLSEYAKKFLSIMSVKDFIFFAENLHCVKHDGSLQDFSADVNKLKNFRLPIKKAFEQYLTEYMRHLNKGKIWLMPLSDELDCTELGFDIIDYSEVFLTGGVEFFESLKRRTKIPLWRDCLPDLAIKRLYGTFDLVKNSSFEYGIETEMIIPIPGNRNFTLPKGQKKYRFNLHMSDSNEKTFYEAVVEHKNFPLKVDTECRLIMKYTYGDDNPYSLKFVPLDKKSAGFNEAMVRWERVEIFAHENLPYPKFPPPRTWDDLRSDKHKYDSGTDDLLEKAVSKLYEITEQSSKIFINPDCYALNSSRSKEISYTRTRYEDKDAVIFSLGNVFRPQDIFFYSWLSRDNKAERYSIDVSDVNWFKNRRQIYQLNCNYSFEGNDYKLVFYEDRFIFSSEFGTDVKRLNFSLKRNRDGSLDAAPNGFLYAQNILVDKGEPIYFFRVNDLSLDNPRYNTYMLEKLLGGLLYCLHEIYFNGRSSALPDCPPDTARGLREGLERVYNMYKSFAPHTVENEMVFNILCVASKDVNPQFEKDIMEYVFDCAHCGKEARYELGFVLGDFTEKHQKDLFEAFRMLDEKNIIGILAKAAWRNEKFIENFPRDLLKKYFEKAIELIVKAKILRVQRAWLMLAFEFVMAVFRLRENADEELSQYLSLNNSALRRFYSQLENLISENYFERVKSRINFDKIKQSVEFEPYNIHDFFYALLVYITGESGDSDIVISSINNSIKN